MTEIVPIVEDRTPTRERAVHWETAIAAFLATKTPHTRRAYRLALRDFYGLTRRTPDDVCAADVAAYRVDLERRGNGPATVAARMAAVSAFYRFLTRPIDARGRAAVASNPMAGIERPRVPAYGRARKAALDDVRAILAALDASEDLGALRDRALVLFYVFTCRRRAEVASLRAGDLFRDDDGRTFYRYVGKGGKAGTRELPPPVVQALGAYLRAAGRENLTEDAPLFVSIRGRTRGRALTADGVLRILKARARAAGVPPSRVRTHGLRHLGAELRRRAGASLEEIQRDLDHANLTTTSIYLRRMEGVKDRTWERVARLLAGSGSGLLDRVDSEK